MSLHDLTLCVGSSLNCVIVLVLNETSLLSKSDVSVSTVLSNSLSRLRTSQVHLVGNLNWFFQIDLARQLFHVGVRLAFEPVIVSST